MRIPWEGGGWTLTESFDPRNNSLNALRLLFAFLVIVSHAWPLGGFGEDPMIGGYSLGAWAVGGFFAISGFLITGSRLKGTLGSYLIRRSLRIFPGLLACLAVILALFVPLSAASSAEGGIPGLEAQVGFFLGNGLMVANDYGIEGSLISVPHAEEWNGSLWTLKYEFACYVMIGVLLSFAVLRARQRSTVVVAFVAVAAARAGDAWLGWSPPGHVELMVQLSAFFLAGAMMFVFADRVRVNWLWAISAFVLLGLAAVLADVPILASLPLAYLCLWLGIVLPLQRVGRVNDVSYGVYIYAFPVQQLLVLFGAAALGVWGFIGLATALTIPFALASWLIVEKPAMRLKNVALPRGIVPSASRRAAAEKVAAPSEPKLETPGAQG